MILNFNEISGNHIKKVFTKNTGVVCTSDVHLVEKRTRLYIYNVFVILFFILKAEVLVWEHELFWPYKSMVIAADRFTI